MLLGAGIRRGVAAVAAAVVSIGTLGLTGPVAQAVTPPAGSSPGLAAVSPDLDPLTGFPRWYGDANGVRLQMCSSAQDFCPAGATAPDPAMPASVPDNMAKEGFYYDAQGLLNSVGAGGAGKAVIDMAVEAAFGNITGAVTPGEQITFSRINLKVTGGLQPNATYQVTDPYGTETVTADATGAVRPPKTAGSRYQRGCGFVPPDCDFGLLLPGRVGPFLTYDPADPGYVAPPAGFLGDGATVHRVTGSPNGTNVFRIVGPGINPDATADACPTVPGPPADCLETDLFALTGKRAGPAQPAEPRIAFGHQETGGTAGHDLALTNVGAAPLTVDTATATGDGFGVDASGCVDVVQDAACTVHVSFAPAVLGAAAGVLRLTTTPSGGGAEPDVVVPLSGIGVAPGTAPAADLTGGPLVFGATRTGVTSAAQHLTLSNTGTAPLTVLGVHLAGGHPRDFAVDSSACTVVAPGAGCDLSVTFTPASGPADRTADLVVDDDTPTSPQSVALSGTAVAGLTGVSANTDPRDGFPRWYEDSSGLRLAPCLAGPNCVVGATLPDPTAAPSIPGNFAKESFYYDASSRISFANGGRATYIAGVEGAFGNIGGAVVQGDQITFSRIQVKVTSGLVPGATYTITEPYGEWTAVADSSGAITPKVVNGRYQVGCNATPPACDFSTLLSGRLGPWLQADPTDVRATVLPDGFLGDGVTFTRVVGSPNGTNFFQIAGPGIGVVRSDDFTLVGREATTPDPPALAPDSDTGISSTDGVTRATTLQVTGVVDPGETVHLYLDGVAAGSTTGAPEDGSWALTVPGVAEGSHQLTATQDVAGVESKPSSPLAVVVDRTPPLAPTLGGTLPASPAATRTPAVVGSAEVPSTVSVWTDGTCAAPAPAGTGTGTALATTGITVTVPADATTALSATATDRAGNTSSCSQPVSFVQDSTPPPAPAFGAGAPAGTVASTTLTFALVAPPASTLQCQLDAAAFTACSTPLTLTGLAQGQHVLAVRAVDAAGNAGLPASRAFVVDTVGPATTVTAPASSAIGTATPTFAFAASEPGATTECALDAASPAWAPCTSPVSFGTLADGSYTLRLRSTDAVGNTGPVASFAFAVSTAAPVVTFAAVVPAVTSNPTPTFSFTAAAGSTFTCSVGGTGGVPCSSPWTPPALPQGSSTVMVTATSAAGTSSTAGYPVTVDSVPPTPPAGFTATGTAPGRVDIVFQPAVDATAVSYLVQRDGVTIARLQAAVLFVDTGIAVGSTHQYAVVAVDAAGNTSSTGLVTAFARDTLAPVVLRAPSLTVAGVAALTAAGLPVTVSWGAADLGGVSRFSLSRRTDSGAWTPVALPRPTVTSVRQVLRPGHTYAFRVQAVDASGRVSTVAVGAPRRVSLTQESGLARAGAWRAARQAGASGGSVLTSSRAGSRLTLRTTATGLALVAVRGPGMGSVAVSVDGGRAATVSLAAGSVRPGSVVWSRAGLSRTPHTLVVRVERPRSGPAARVAVDGVVVVG